MPRLEEVQYYFRGLWLLLMGRLEGFGWLDFSERGFWRSWWAVVYCLPAMMLSWAGLRMYYLSAMPAGAVAGPTYIAKLVVIDAATWIISYLALAIAMLVSGYASRIVPMIIAINWLSVPLQWLGICGSLILIFSPNNLDLYQSVGLPLLLASAAAHFMVIRQIADRKTLPASTFLLTLIVADIWSTSAVGDALGIWPS